VSIEGGAQGGESTKYPFDLQHVTFNALFVMFGVRRACSSSESPLDFTRDPGPTWYGEQTWPRLVEIPFRILQRRPYRFVETPCVLPLDCDIQHLAYVETGLRYLHGIFVIDHLALLDN